MRRPTARLGQLIGRKWFPRLSRPSEMINGTLPRSVAAGRGRASVASALFDAAFVPLPARAPDQDQHLVVANIEGGLMGSRMAPRG